MATTVEEGSQVLEKPLQEKKRINGNGHHNGNGSHEKPKYNFDSPPDEIKELRLKNIVRHITHVQQSCTLLGERLIASGDKEIGHKLIANGFIHDNSKFHGIEWLYLHDDLKVCEPEMFQMALHQHQTRNPHHPEYWDGIENMPRVYLAEMVCDWHARGHEFGTDLRAFIKNHATKKFNFTLQGKVYKEIKGFVDMLLDPAFVKV